MAKAQRSVPHSRPAAKPGRPMWSGSISFGLVNIPVSLFPAIRPKDVRFHLLHETDKSRLREKLICPADQQEVERSETVKGYEVSKGHLVVVRPEELEALAPKATRTIELLQVVELTHIDPMFFDRPYYLLPEERAAKSYSLLVEALKSTGRGAIAKFVMRNKEYVGALRPIQNVLCLDTLHFADEIIPVRDLHWNEPNSHLRDAEVKMAIQLLESLSGEFQPSLLHDDFRYAVLRLIERKAKGQQIVAPLPTEEEGPEVIDLMDALKKSVAHLQRQKRKAA